MKHHMLFLLTCVILLGVFLYPRVPALVGSSQKDMFLADIQKTHTVDYAAFWKWREFYSIGNFRFDRNGLASRQEDLKAMGLNEEMIMDPEILVTTSFDSQNIQSIEGLTKRDTIESIIQLPKGKFLVKSHTLYFIDNGAVYFLIILQPTEEMLIADGFYKPKSIDRDLFSKYSKAISISRILK